MANDLIKAGIKYFTAAITLAFGAKVGKEGKKNYDNWKNSKLKSDK